MFGHSDCICGTSFQLGKKFSENALWKIEVDHVFRDLYCIAVQKWSLPSFQQRK